MFVRDIVARKSSSVPWLISAAVETSMATHAREAIVDAISKIFLFVRYKAFFASTQKRRIAGFSGTGTCGLMNYVGVE